MLKAKKVWRKRPSKTIPDKIVLTKKINFIFRPNSCPFLLLISMSILPTFGDQLSGTGEDSISDPKKEDSISDPKKDDSIKDPKIESKE